MLHTMRMRFSAHRKQRLLRLSALAESFAASISESITTPWQQQPLLARRHPKHLSRWVCLSYVHPDEQNGIDARQKGREAVLRMGMVQLAVIRFAYPSASHELAQGTKLHTRRTTRCTTVCRSQQQPLALHGGGFVPGLRRHG